MFRMLTQERNPDTQPLAAAAVEYTAIAVLPFVNMSPEPVRTSLATALPKRSSTPLLRSKMLRSFRGHRRFSSKGRPRTFAKWGEMPGAQLIAEGGVRKADDQLRVTAQAIETAKGYHLWSETYRRELRDVFAVQEEISTALASMVAPICRCAL